MIILESSLKVCSCSTIIFTTFTVFLCLQELQKKHIVTYVHTNDGVCELHSSLRLCKYYHNTATHGYAGLTPEVHLLMSSAGALIPWVTINNLIVGTRKPQLKMATREENLPKDKHCVRFKVEVHDVRTVSSLFGTNQDIASPSHREKVVTKGGKLYLSGRMDE